MKRQKVNLMYFVNRKWQKEEVDAYVEKVKNFCTVIIHGESGNWQVSEYRSGARMCYGATTLQGAKNKMRERVRGVIQRRKLKQTPEEHINEMVEMFIKNNGVANE